MPDRDVKPSVCEIPGLRHAGVGKSVLFARLNNEGQRTSAGKAMAF